tara:strand:- start:156 stop:929 length:774 start_codon:yes stop_codon:yes gene_type:complete
MGKHSIKSFSAALFKKPFYLAFINIFIYFKNPIKILTCYVFEIGGYPKNIFVRTPVGVQCMAVFSYHDLITVIECFGKLDYKASENCSVIVDFGSNIGISALYFLTRSQEVKVYLFEPDPRNIERLKQNLKGFEKRYELKECAVGVLNGRLDFACDDTGRYGGLVNADLSCFSDLNQKIITVDVVSANQVLDEVLSQHNVIDIVKIDVEGYENKILGSLRGDCTSRINRIYAETEEDQEIPGFSSERYGGLIRYYRK